MEGQYRVGAVILNRVHSEDFPDTICEVIQQPGQFATTISTTGTIQEKVISAFVAVDLYYNYLPNDEVLWFYDPSQVNPEWASSLIPAFEVGNHLFLRSSSNK